MKIRSKLLIIFICGMIIFALLSVIILKFLVVDNIEEEETKLAYQSYKSVVQILQKEEEALNAMALDWAQWDDTYQFVADRNADYVETYLQDSTIEPLHLNFMVFVNKAGNSVYTRTYELNPAMQDDLPANLLQQVNLDQEKESLSQNDQWLAGLIVLKGKPFLLSVAPVTSSDGTAPKRGFLLIGRELSEGYVQYLEQVAKISITLDNAQNWGIGDGPGKDYQKTVFEGNSLWIKKNVDTLTVYSPLADIHGQKTIFFSYNVERKMYQDNLQAIFYFIIAFLGTLIFVVIGCLLFFDHAVLNRLNRLHHFMETVSRQKNTSERIDLPGRDEISSLAVITNRMLAELDRVYAITKKNEERYKLIMETTNDGYFDWNLLTQNIYINSEWLRFMGRNPLENDIEFNRYLESVMPADRDLLLKTINDCISGETEKLCVEYRVVKSSGEEIWIYIRGKVIEYDASGNPTRITGTITDVTTRKKYEEENKYLSQTDKITGLKNRVYLEPILNQADRNPQWNCWIIIGDLNGLKLINDTFGQEQGDQLLHKVGDVLRRCCSSEDISVRWGGDEFIIFIKNDTQEYIEDLTRTILWECDRIKDFPFKISMALGYAGRSMNNSDMNSVIKLAEERMQRNKLLINNSARNSILTSLEQTLHEKDIETVEHTQRIKNTCLRIGRRLGLKQAELDELSLLGALHDIGKIGIPESILLKPGKLAKDEWETMTKHVEIGYRIALSTPDLAHIADYILTHHEKYDGTGYPQGLKGEEIPKLSRLMTIVDSFDVMTHDRIYQKAKSKEDAVQELIHCSGKQFDPEMVQTFIDLLQESQQEEL